MAVLFPSHPDAISNTIKIAERCQEDVVKGPLVPNTSVPARFYDADERLRQLVMRGIGQRYPKNRESALERVEYELSIIKDKHYAFLYLIIDECLKITNEQSIAAGPGNGGVINSIIAYILGITNIDPLKYDLFFEHFINPDKDGSGSFTLNTIDYSNEEKIKSYINKTYPGDVVPYSARIIGQFTPAVKLFRDLIKVFYKDDKEQEKVLKFFANMDKWDDDLLKIITDESVVENFSNDAIFHKIVSIANKFPNLTSSFKLSDDDIIFLKDPSLIPLYTNSGISGPQYSCDELEKLGCISCKIQSSWGYSKIAQKINKIKSEYPHFNINEISENDHATMKQIIENNHPLKELNLSSLSELIPIYAVYELQYEDYLIYMKNCILKKKRITYLHKCLKDILKETYGIIAYNEQIIKIITKLTGFSLGKSDAIFTILQKRNYLKIDQEKEEFIAAAKIKKFSHSKAEHIFDTLRSFAPLTSGKGDIIAKAVLDYQAAYVKVHFQRDA
jgi:DNA polymerase-3 subunit alpha